MKIKAIVIGAMLLLGGCSSSLSIEEQLTVERKEFEDMQEAIRWAGADLFWCRERCTRKLFNDDYSSNHDRYKICHIECTNKFE